jgi:hypothetical protein
MSENCVSAVSTTAPYLWKTHSLCIFFLVPLSPVVFTTPLQEQSLLVWILARIRMSATPWASPQHQMDRIISDSPPRTWVFPTSLGFWSGDVWGSFHPTTLGYLRLSTKNMAHLDMLEFVLFCSPTGYGHAGVVSLPHLLGTHRL